MNNQRHLTTMKAYLPSERQNPLTAEKQVLCSSKTTEIIKMKQNRSFAILIFVVIAGVGAALAYARYKAAANLEAAGIGVGAFVLALAVSYAIRVADQWDRAVILRLAHFHALKGPGLFLIIPVIDAIPYWIDTPVITTGFKAEKTLTKDTVPGGCGCRTLLESGGPKEGGLGCGGLPKRHRLGLANRPARCDRQDHAFGYAGRPGQNQQPAAEGH